MGDEVLTLEVTTCRDCPRFSVREVRHWMAGHQILYEYRCRKAGRDITPHDGVKPPPKWCPLRETA